ncbi:LysM peptidoglycan-binding domain-containing protein [Citricoccus sp. GCM10030269]|uniref:LysM peptidoglycan-binding domain-containing protein n=1 Tax=Citricoccus sp. GCM10030269 TaxID=3273388 RepID=UPI00361F62B0
MSTLPHDRRPSLRGEDLLLTVLCTAAGPLLWWLGSQVLRGSSGHGGLELVERLVASACAGAGAVVALWWFLAMVGAVLAACGFRLRSARLARLGSALSPAFLRRVAASVLGVNLLIAPGAWADTQAVGTTASSHTSSMQAPTPVGQDHRELPSPTWRPTPPVPAVPGSARTTETAAEQHRSATVRQGDCLWDIAARELGPYATDLEVDRRWRQWHQHNRPAIGPDADLLIPGTVLEAPTLD